MEPAPRYPGLERLICVALADEVFASRLLADPASALHEVIAVVRLSSVEQQIVQHIVGATDIHDFAARLYARVQSR